MTDVLREDNYKNIIPSANTLEEAINYIKKLYGTIEGVFTAYYFEMLRIHSPIIRFKTAREVYNASSVLTVSVP